MARLNGSRGCGFVGALAIGVAGLLLSAPAEAMELGVGLMGAVGGNFQSKPSDRPPQYLDSNPGFGGLTAGGGLIVDGRLVDFFGIELDVLRTSDHGSGTITVNGIDGTLSIGQPAWHIPILAKFTIPSPVVAPQFFLGPEVVIPGDGEAKLTGALAAYNALTLTAKADTYVMITGGAGVEIKVPLPVLDLRIPISLRGSYNPSLSSKFLDRTKFSPTLTAVTYDSAWQFAINVTAGAAIYF